MKHRFVTLAAATAACIGLTLALVPGISTAQDASLQPTVIDGVTGPDERFTSLVVVGGKNTYQRDGLYEAAFCGGTKVSARRIITAAHCVIDDNGRPLPAGKIIVGSTPSGELDATDAVVINVRSVKIHPQYNDDRATNDIAVLTLRTTLRGIPNVTIALPADDESLLAPGEPLISAGWGALRRDGTDYPNEYRVADVVAFPRGSCGRNAAYTVADVRFRGYPSSQANPRVMVCASGVSQDSIVDTCNGDSGGPLLGGTAENQRLVGVVSWGPPRCASKRPGVYTRVSAMTDFLADTGVPIPPIG